MLNQLKKNHFYLIETAKKLISQRFKENRHHFAAAVKSKDGKIFTGLQLKASIAGAEICAEAVALANAAEEGVTDIEALVVVNRIGEVISPCGKCRELFLDYCPKAEIIVPGVAGAKIVTPFELLPARASLIDDKPAA
ncbi:MAG: cytidine deaminase [Candidatus Riflebacteria bacterium HGW-Riflebacteria-1]|jgi:cytidine deaminase|nr:MAG: cytidine deaminase [Candidatus Riflebacteria bacterium HGW-Riflebacteria-1]